MKSSISVQEQVFKPVTLSITFESQEEIENFYNIFCNIVPTELEDAILSNRFSDKDKEIKIDTNIISKINHSIYCTLHNYKIKQR